MIHCKELNKDFDSKDELIKNLRLHKDDIISFKKAQIYKSFEKGLGVRAKSIDISKLSTQIKGLDIDNNYFYIAVNTTYILDSHLDLHINGLWNKTAKDQKGKVYLVDSHVLSVKTTFAKKEDIEIIIAEIPFAAIGKPYDGNTQALIYKIKKDKITDLEVKQWLESNYDIEASVRMQYVNIDFAINSDDKEDVKYKDNYDNYINKIANKDDFDTEIIYFWVVKEAKNVLESSLVLFGSNGATGLIEDHNKFQPSANTGKQNKEPSLDTQKKEFYLSQLKNK